MSKQTEQLLCDLQDAIVADLLNKAKTGELTAAEMKVATELIRYHKISLDPTAPGNPMKLLEDALPFESDTLTFDQ